MRVAEHARLDVFLAPFSSLKFESRLCGEVRRDPSCARAKGRNDRAARSPDRRRCPSTRLDAGDAQYGEFSRISALRLEDWEP
jgi:hypothetical protein